MSKQESLLQKAQAFDAEALRQIFDNHYEQIYRYVYRRLGNQQRAENIASETFTRLLDAFQKGSGPSDGVLYWLYRVAHNLVVDLYRQSNREPLPLLQDVLSDPDPLPEEDVITHQEEARVRWALNQLTEDQQQVLELKFMEDMDNKQVAAVLQKTVGSVKSLQHRGLASLERVLKEAADQGITHDLPGQGELGLG